mmetsp:Transcript_62578/g.162417  ORF Transcript_62578/g.162417 Transcript_62578/m.162417 type:complete len:87 (+) Transcript_62578:1706-1966(+)
MYIDRSKALCLVGSLGAWSRLRDLLVKMSCVFFAEKGSTTLPLRQQLQVLQQCSSDCLNSKHVHAMPVPARYPRWLALGVDKTQKC